MATAKKATAAAVSRALTEGGLTKSESYATRIKGWRDSTPGFTAHTDKDYVDGTYQATGTVTVEWVAGLRSDNELSAKRLAQAAEILTAKGYEATVETSPFGRPSLRARRPSA